MNLERDHLINHALEAAIYVDIELNLLVSSCDDYITSFQERLQTPSMNHELSELNVSIQELLVLPELLNQRFQEWSCDIKPQQRWLEFEELVIDELELHMRSVTTFTAGKRLLRRRIDQAAIHEAFEVLRACNLRLSTLELPAKK